MQARRSRKIDERETHTPEQIRRRTFARAIKLLAARPRSVAELRERLLKARWADSVAVETAIERLKEYGYLDDERFAFGYASLRVRQKPLGRNRLKRDLAFKKVEKTVADEALNLVYGETSEEELINRAIEKRLRIRGKPKTRIEAKSLLDHLLRQGFPFELSLEKVRAATHLADESDEPM